MKTQTAESTIEKCAICAGKVIVAAIGMTCVGMLAFQIYSLVSVLL